MIKKYVLPAIAITALVFSIYTVVLARRTPPPAETSSRRRACRGASAPSPVPG